MAEEAPQGYEFTQAEKDKIRAEMDYRAAIARLLEPPKHARHGFYKGLNEAWAALNQPLIITALSGILLSVVSAKIQDKSAENQRQEARAVQMQDKKYDLLASAAASLDKYNATLTNQRKVSLWLGQTHTSQETYHGGRSLMETKKLRDSLNDRLNAQPSPIVAINQIKALFVSESVKKWAEKTRIAIDAVGSGELKSDAQIQAAADEADTDTRKLTEAMGAEISRPAHQ